MSADRTEDRAPVSVRIRYQLLGGHVHARVFSSEFGPQTSHGLNGTLTFRPAEFAAFRATLELGRESGTAIEFVDDESGC